MLQMQIRCWNTYAGILRDLPTVLLIDDGSPKTPALDVFQRHPCRIPVQVYRIQEDIPWNFTGARNLGCHHAKEWIYVSDIDTLLLAADAKRLFESQALSKAHYYMPKRVLFPTLKELRPGIVNLLYHKDKYLACGGYDEDYAGHYGREESDFRARLRRVATLVPRDDALIRVVRPHLVPDACTHGRARDNTRNVALYERKEAAGFPLPLRPLRFSWARVL